MNEQKKWIGKKVKVFIKGLADRPIIYSGEVISVNDNFLTMIDQKTGKEYDINTSNIIQMCEDEDFHQPSFYQP